MNERLEIAARIMAAWCQSDDEVVNPHVAASQALGWADALIARERETRPKCEHPRLMRGIGLRENDCLACGAKVEPQCEHPMKDTL